MNKFKLLDKTSQEKMLIEIKKKKQSEHCETVATKLDSFSSWKKLNELILQ